MDDQYAEYLPHIRQRWLAEQASWEARRQQAWRVAHQIAAMLRSQFGANQIMAFGSLTARGPFDGRSDIDLGVSGIKHADFFRAYARAMAISTAFKIDLVDLDDCPSRIRESITQFGVPL